MASPTIKTLRKVIAEKGLNAVIIPSTDPHQSEYVPEAWQRRAFVSGFTGSAGDLVVTENKAALWTDSRYYLQAEKQLMNTGIDLCRQGNPGTPSIQEWLGDALPKGAMVGVDPCLFSRKSYTKYAKALNKSGIVLAPVTENPVDGVWHDRPPFPRKPISAWPDSFAGKTVQEKLDILRDRMRATQTEYHVIAPLDAVAWLFNLRGSDVQYNPVFIAYAVIGQESAHLFVDPGQVTEAVRQHLSGIVDLHAYDSFGDFLDQIGRGGAPVLFDPETTSQWIYTRLRSPKNAVFMQSPISLMKAIKNDTELSGIQSAHIRDGVAMVNFLSWLEETVGANSVTELGAAEKLAQFRMQGERYIGPSFGTISAFGENGAIVHYEADTASNKTLTPDNLYLIDSGAQYLDGTTDITRTIAIGAPTDEQKTCFTRVLKGHINLAMTRFPVGTTGIQLDTIARKPLWDIGLNYGHGTGHGVGAYLNVHEGPHSISYYRGFGVQLEDGMVLSIEPGYYKPGRFGIRIENLVRVTKNPHLSTQDATFFSFEPLTLCPIDQKLIIPTLLDSAEIGYLDTYHETVYRELHAFLSDSVKEWLREATRPVDR